MSNTSPATSSLKIYFRLLRYLKPFIGYFATSIAGYLVYASAQPMLAGVLKYFVDGLTPAKSGAGTTLPLL